MSNRMQNSTESFISAGLYNNKHICLHFSVEVSNFNFLGFEPITATETEWKTEAERMMSAGKLNW